MLAHHYVAACRYELGYRYVRMVDAIGDYKYEGTWDRAVSAARQNFNKLT